MRTPYRTIKWNHSTWGVPQEEYDRVVEELEKALDGKMLAEIFTPQQLVIEDAIRNTIGRRFDKSIGDVISPDWNTYYHYFWFEDDKTTAYDWRSTWVFVKKKWSNPSFYKWTYIPENRHYSNSVYRNVNFRIKIDGNDVKASTLIFREYDSNDFSSHWWKVTLTLYCVNYTNSSVSDLITLGSKWNLDDKYSYNYTEIENRDELRTASCWITAEESIAPIWKWTISLVRWSDSNYANVVCTLT